MVSIVSIRRLLLALIIAQPVAQLCAAPAETVDQAAVAAAAPLSPWELSRLYADHTWMWDNGAAYFARDGRQFRAWTGGDNLSIGQGRWLITEDGKLCMKAQWTTRAGSAPAQTCFSHRKLLGTTYQMKDPDGPWYVFKATPPQAAQEYSKFRTGDETAMSFEKIRKIVSPGKHSQLDQAVGGCSGLLSGAGRAPCRAMIASTIAP